MDSPFTPYQRVNSGAAAGQLRKEAGIKKMVDRKEQSMAEFAIRRDAAMFASVTGAGKDRKGITDEYIYWTEFFSNIYLPPAPPVKSTAELLETTSKNQTTIKVDDGKKPQENLLE